MCSKFLTLCLFFFSFFFSASLVVNGGGDGLRVVDNSPVPDKVGVIAEYPHVWSNNIQSYPRLEFTLNKSVYQATAVPCCFVFTGTDAGQRG